VEGRDYRRLEQTIEGAPEVIELFYYGCRACYHLTDELDDWSRDQKITLSLVPAHGQNHLVMVHVYSIPWACWAVWTFIVTPMSCFRSPVSLKVRTASTPCSMSRVSLVKTSGIPGVAMR